MFNFQIIFIILKMLKYEKSVFRKNESYQVSRQNVFPFNSTEVAACGEDVDLPKEAA